MRGGHIGLFGLAIAALVLVSRVGLSAPDAPTYTDNAVEDDKRKPGNPGPVKHASDTKDRLLGDTLPVPYTTAVGVAVPPTTADRLSVPPAAAASASNATPKPTPGVVPAAVSAKSGEPAPVSAPKELAPAASAESSATPPITGAAAPSASTFQLATDPEILAKTKAMALRGLQREVEKYDEMTSVISWNNWLGRFIFVVVHGILGLALCISWREFKSAHETRSLAKARTKGKMHAEQRAMTAEDVQELELSLDGVALKTSRHGTMILLVAFAFYVAYLKFVYPVQIISTDVPANKESPSEHKD